MPSHGRLTQALDRDVLAIAQKFINDDISPLPRASELHNHITRSNSSLKRRPQKQLQDSIERVLRIIKNDRDQTDMSSNESGERAMNRRLTTHWASSASKIQAVDDQDDVNMLSEPAKRSSTGQTSPSKKMRSNRAARAPPDLSDFHGFGGFDDIADQLLSTIELPLRANPAWEARPFFRPTGFLVHGPAGCGKTQFVNYLAARIQVPFVSFLALSVFSATAGESEKTLFRYFEEAKELSPCILFIDQLDDLQSKADNNRQTDMLLIQKLIDCMKDLMRHNRAAGRVIVIAAARMPDNLNSDLIQAGVFKRKIAIPYPDAARREAILFAILKNGSYEEKVDAKQLAKRTQNFIARDLEELVGNIIDAADNRIKLLESSGTERTGSDIIEEDIQKALNATEPRMRSEGYSEIPDLPSEHIGALTDAKEELEFSVIDRITRPEIWASLSKDERAAGVLLYGPPGCGKTLLVKWVASVCKASFISVKSSEMINKFLGESEKALKNVFERARAAQPCILFFDEIDSFAPKRSGESTESINRFVNTFLVEMDGIDQRGSVFVIGATNRRDIIDPALLRHGRFETEIYVGLPNEEGRVDILKAQCLAKGVEFDASIAAIARQCEGFSGADLDGLLAKATKAAYKRLRRDETGNEPRGVIDSDWENALKQIRAGNAQEKASREK